MLNTKYLHTTWYKADIKHQTRRRRVATFSVSMSTCNAVAPLNSVKNRIQWVAHVNYMCPFLTTHCPLYPIGSTYGRLSSTVSMSHLTCRRSQKRSSDVFHGPVLYVVVHFVLGLRLSKRLERTRGGWRWSWYRQAWK